MRIATLLSALCALAVARAEQRTAQVYVQPIQASAPSPAPLAEVFYDYDAATSTSRIVSYEAPDLPESVELVRIGLYDPKSAKWLSGTTVAAAANFDKGFAPTVLLTVDVRGDVISAALKGVKIDAGQTRDFGPASMVFGEKEGKQPELNKPVVLSPTGHKVVEEPAKTFLQRYVNFCRGLGLHAGANLRQVLVGDSYHGGVGDDRWRRQVDAKLSSCDNHETLKALSCDSRPVSAVNYEVWSTMASPFTDLGSWGT